MYPAPANRIAFGAALGRPTADAQTGYREIQPYTAEDKFVFGSW